MNIKKALLKRGAFFYKILLIPLLLLYFGLFFERACMSGCESDAELDEKDFAEMIEAAKHTSGFLGEIVEYLNVHLRALTDPLEDNPENRIAELGNGNKSLIPENQNPEVLADYIRAEIQRVEDVILRVGSTPLNELETTLRMVVGALRTQYGFLFE